MIFYILLFCYWLWATHIMIREGLKVLSHTQYIDIYDIFCFVMGVIGSAIFVWCVIDINTPRFKNPFYKESE